MKTSTTSAGRKGAALLMAMVAMAVLTVVLSVLTTQIISQRQMVRQRHRQLQAEWLARAGVESAAARLLEKPAAFIDDKQELMPDAKLRVVVEKADQDSYTVTAEAQIGMEDGRAVVRTMTGRFRRSDKGGDVRLEAVELIQKKGP